MTSIKNFNAAIAKQPEEAGTEVKRKGTDLKQLGQAPVSPKTAGASAQGNRPLAEPFAARRSDARSMAGKTPRATENPGE